MTGTATIDRSAIRANVAALREFADGARVCAVVKADGYGHGAVETAGAALAAGASWLAVASPAEAVELREAGIDPAVPVLLLSEPDPAELAAHASSLPAGIRFTVGSRGATAALEKIRPGALPIPVHLKIDTGMHRVGVAPSEAIALARSVVGSAALHLEGTWTHFAVADDPDDPFTAAQTACFDEALASLRAAGIDPGIAHMANSAGTIAHPHSRRDLVRVGISIYGIAPSPALEREVTLRPALRLTAPVTAVRTVDAGESVGYGRHWYAEGPTRVATAALGYADGIRRASAAAGVEVLIRGRRAPMLGVVTMDQLMVAADDVAVGDEVVVIGRQGDEEITVNEIAGRLGTIGYEVVTGIGPRVRRIHVG